MKNPFKAILNWFKRQLRKLQKRKREKLYDDVTNTLSKLNSEKQKNQQELIQEIKDNWKVITGLHYGSEYIPNSHTTKEEVLNKIQKEYFFKMQALNIELKNDLSFVCK